MLAVYCIVVVNVKWICTNNLNVTKARGKLLGPEILYAPASCSIVVRARCAVCVSLWSYAIATVCSDVRYHAYTFTFAGMLGVVNVRFKVYYEIFPLEKEAATQSQYS